VGIETMPQETPEQRAARLEKWVNELRAALQVNATNLKELIKTMSQETPEQRTERLDALTQKLRAALRVSSTQLSQLITELNAEEPDKTQAGRQNSLLELEQELAELERRVNFVNLPNAERCRVLANRLGATETATDDPNLFKLQFNERFPVHLPNCRLYFPPVDWAVQDVVTHLQLDQIAFDVIVIISLEPAQQKGLRSYGEDTTTLWVVPNIDELTTLLLSEEPIQVFIKRLVAAQLKITHISPYQTVGAIQSQMMFFGRTQLLAHILGRAPTNYLLIGGRQLGKSSILRYIERHYKNSKVECHYMELYDHNLQPHLAKALNLPIDTDLPVLLENLANVPDGQRRLLLIDEADLFIRHEMEQKYPMLRHFRALSGEGRCHFIFAGFWNLYEATLLDFLSPIRNFGEPVFVGELEAEGCRDLATKPMVMLGINYSSTELVEHILEQTGQRANLIATICDQMLKRLANEQRTVINQEDVRQALQSREVEGGLVGYAKLTNEEQAARLDRLIIYTTADNRIMLQQGVMKFVKPLFNALSSRWGRGKKEGFTLAEVMDNLDRCNCSYTAEQLKQSLARLELAFIIRREGEYYRYCVPLFQQMLKVLDLASLLRAEVVSYQ
jgi:hypothetical protein